MKTIVKTMVIVSSLMLITFGCKKTTPEVIMPSTMEQQTTESSNTKQHRVTCTRQQVTTCDSLVIEMNKLKGISCGIFPCCFPSSCLSSPTYTTTICVDRIAGSSGDCSTATYSIVEQDTLVERTKRAIINHLVGVCGSNYSYTVSSFAWQSGSNGCSTTHPWLKVTFKYKCCN